ncbi:hypothetical protein B0H12DRAFT_1076692 [Mycena haematopus]|nr:hypothetical protein B0H12DRAFT_1076692 [Mycena haematopus]
MGKYYVAVLAVRGLRSGTWRLKALRARAEKGRCPRQPSIIDRGSKFSSVSTLAPRANNDVNNGKPFLQGPYCKGCVKHQQKLLQDTVEALEEAEEDVRPDDGARKIGQRDFGKIEGCVKIRNKGQINTGILALVNISWRA